MTSEQFRELTTPAPNEDLLKEFLDETGAFVGWADPAEQLCAAIAWGYRRGREKHAENTGANDGA